MMMKKYARHVGIILAGLACQAGSTETAQRPAEARNTPHEHDYFIIRNGLTNSRARFDERKKARVAFLGGSITAMSGWRNLVQTELKQRYRDTTFDFIDAGIGSLDSTAHSFRFSRDILKNGSVDLLFVEAAVNDALNGRIPTEQLRGMEGIVRQARMANPAMDIILLHFVDPAKIVAIKAGTRPDVILIHEKVADHYGLPSIDLAQEVTERIQAGEFTWEKDFINLHPSPFGHELYARSIFRLFDATWESLQSAPVQLHEHVLPEPLDPFNYCSGRLLPPDTADFNGGFRLHRSWTPTDNVGTRPGFVNVPMAVAEAAGAVTTYAFTGKAIGLFVIAGPDAGTIEYRIDHGEVKTQDLYQRFSGGLHLPAIQMLASDLTETDHVLELKVSTMRNPASKGHAVRIVHFLAQDAK